MLSEPLLLSRSHVYRVGREKTCEIRINSSRVSRQHAQLRFVKGGFEVTDLRSTNGSFVNGIRLKQPCLLHDGDTLTFGGYEVEVKVVNPGELEDDGGGATLPIRRRRPA